MAQGIIVTGNWSDTKFVKGTPAWTGTMSWLVTGTSNLVSAVAAVPMTRGGTHPEAGLMFCTELSGDNAGGPFAWTVTAQFSSIAPTATEENPLNEPPRYKWEKAEMTVMTDRNYEGHVFRNSAWDVPSNLQPRTITMLTVTVLLNEPMYDPRPAMGFMDHVNENEFTVKGVPFLPLTGLCKRIIPDRAISSRDKFVPNIYEIHFLPGFTPKELSGDVSPWDFAFPDKGPRAYTRVGSVLTPGLFYNASTEPYAGDAMLDGTGFPIDTSLKVGKLRGDVVARETPPGFTVDKFNGSTLMRIKKFPRANFAFNF